MSEKPTWWQMMKVKLSMGKWFAPVIDLGQPDHHTIIRFKDYYVGLMEKDGEIISFGWSKDPHMFPDVNINDFWLATHNKPKSTEKTNDKEKLNIGGK